MYLEIKGSAEEKRWEAMIAISTTGRNLEAFRKFVKLQELHREKIIFKEGNKFLVREPYAFVYKGEEIQIHIVYRLARSIPRPATRVAEDAKLLLEALERSIAEEEGETT